MRSPTAGIPAYVTERRWGAAVEQKLTGNDSEDQVDAEFQSEEEQSAPVTRLFALSLAKEWIEVAPPLLAAATDPPVSHSPSS